MSTRRKFLQHLSLAGSTAIATAAMEAVNPNLQQVLGSPGVKNLTKLKIGGVPGLGSLDIFVASKLGYYKDAGLDVEIIKFNNSGRMRDALIAGQLDFTAQSPLHVYLAQQRGVPLRVVATRRDIVDSKLFVHTKLKGKTQKEGVAGLRGASIAVTSLGSYSWALAQRYIKLNGLDPEKDVQYVSSEASSVYTLLKSGKVDVGITSAPESIRLAQEGTAFALVDPAFPAIHRKYFGSDRALTLGYLTHERIFKDQANLIARIVEANNRVLKYLRNAPLDKIADAVDEHFQGTPKDILIKSIKDAQQSLAKDSTISRKAYETDMNIYLETGIIKKPVPYSEGARDVEAGKRA